MNTTEFLMIANAICPDRDMMVFEGQQFTYAQIDERINRLANALAYMGVQKGDRVGMLQVNCNQYIETYFAAARLGAIFVPMNFRAKADELGYLLKNSETKVLFVGGRYLDLVEPVLPELPTVGPCRDWDERACHIYFDHDRDRKTGPDFPLRVARCVTHKKGFTIYPPGYAPYGRQRLAPVAPDGSLVVNRSAVIASIPPQDW